MSETMTARQATACDTVDRLTRAAVALRKFWKRFRETAERPGTDKAYAGFDSRYPECSVLDIPTGKRGISFIAHAGQYGRSGTKTIEIGGGVNSETVRPYFERALNVHAEAIFETMAALMEQDARERIAGARSELATMRTRLDRLEKNGNETGDGSNTAATPTS